MSDIITGWALKKREDQISRPDISQYTLANPLNTHTHNLTYFYMGGGTFDPSTSYTNYTSPMTLGGKSPRWTCKRESTHHYTGPLSQEKKKNSNPKT